MKSLKEAEANANKLSQDQIMELLDWSDSENEKKDAWFGTVDICFFQFCVGIWIVDLSDFI